MPVMRVVELQRQIVSTLSPRYGEREAKAMMRLVFYALKGWDLTALTVNYDREVSDYTIEKVKDIVRRLEKGEPLQYILGTARFYGMNLGVSQAVLIPRPETEELVDIIVRQNPEKDLRVLDIGTGSGAIAIALSRNLKFPTVTALDVSEKALEVATRNASDLHADINFVRQDVFTYRPEPNSYDIIVSNPPYVTEAEKKQMDRNVLDFEPPLALFVPDDNPLLYYSRIAEIALTALRKNGRLYFEINPLFASDLKRMLINMGYREVELLEDISFKLRFAKAVR